MFAPHTYVRIKAKPGSVRNIAGFWGVADISSYDKYQQTILKDLCMFCTNVFLRAGSGAGS